MFFAGNDKLILIKKQSDKDTPVTDFSDALALRVYEWGKEASRTVVELVESDATAQQGRSHVSQIGPAISFGIYGRPDWLAAIAEAVLGDNDDSATMSPTTHSAIPDQATPYYSIMEVLPYTASVWDGCRCIGATYAADDSGETDLKVTGIQWMALGLTLHQTAPDPLPQPSSEAPFIYAEAAISYAGDHLGSTTGFSWVINRNAKRAQGDSGFRALDVVNGKFQTDGSVTRYTADDSILRAVDTGSKTGTDLTSAIYSEALAVLFSRGTGADARSFLISAPEVSYESREEALNGDGSPYQEVLAFRTQPQADIADHIAIVTVNSQPTTGV